MVADARETDPAVLVTERLVALTAPDWVTLPAVVRAMAAPSSPAMAMPSLSLKLMPRPVLVIASVTTSLVADARETLPAPVLVTERLLALTAADWVTSPAVVRVTEEPSRPAMAMPSLSLKSMTRPVLVMVRVPTSLVADARETDPAVAVTIRVFATIGFVS